MIDDIEQYKARFQHHFAELLRAAEAKNELYYLLNLLHAWGQVGPMSRRTGESMDFNVEVNRLTNMLILDRIRHGRAEPIPPHDALFILQLNMEAKAVYGTIRNFANICRGEWVGQEPWLVGEMGRRGLLTGKIVTNVAWELGDAGFTDLAAEFEAVHTGEAMTIRHAVAHGAFRFPSEDTGGQWVFGEYTGTPPRHVTVKTTRMSPEKFTEVSRRFLVFRLAFFSAVEEALATARSRTSSFQAPNQMEAGELLDCRIDKGQIHVKHKGASLW